jgi:hypothetical protein
VSPGANQRGAATFYGAELRALPVRLRSAARRNARARGAPPRVRQHDPRSYWPRKRRCASGAGCARLQARTARRSHVISRSWRRALGRRGAAASGALVRARWQERGERGGAWRRVARRGSVLRARSAAAARNPRGAATFHVAELKACVGRSVEGRLLGARQGALAKLAESERVLGAAQDVEDAWLQRHAPAFSFHRGDVVSPLRRRT